MARAWAEFYASAALLMLATGRDAAAGEYLRLAFGFAAEAVIEEGR